MRNAIRGITGAAVVLVSTATYHTAAAQQVNPAIVISQVYGGGGNSGATIKHDFVELFNRSSSAVSIGGWTLQYASASGAFDGNSPTLTTPLPSVTIQPGQYFLVREAIGAGGTVDIASDFADPTPIAMSATGAKIALVDTTTSLACGDTTTCAPMAGHIVDLFGWGATTSFFEGATGPATTNTTSALRAGNGCTDTNNNAMNFATGAPSPRNTASALNNCGGGDLAPSVTGTSPVEGGQLAPGADIAISFSEAVNAPASAFTLACTVTPSPVPFVIAGGPSVFALHPSASFAPGESCTVTIAGSGITDQDGVPNAMAADYTFHFSVSAGSCGAGATKISAVQGAGAASPLVNTVVEIEGIVTGDFQGSTGLSGFFVQEEPTDYDGDVNTSEGIFVFDNTLGVAVAPGDRVHVRGTVKEFNDLTELSPVTLVQVCAGGQSLPPSEFPTFPRPAPVAGVDYLERFEGMRVTLPATMYVTETFNLGHFGELKLSSLGQLFQPTNQVLPGSAANALQQSNDLTTIELDDGSSVANPAPFPPFLNGTNTLRPNDALQNVAGVLGYSFGAYEVQPTAPPGTITVTTNNPRPGPPSVPGRLKIVMWNVLNYFTTLDGGPGLCLGGLDCRGANTAAELQRQKDKTQAGLTALDADVYGLAEIENNASASLDSLRTLLGPGYDYVQVTTHNAPGNPAGTIGTDAIKIAFFYRTTTIEPVGPYAILDSTTPGGFGFDSSKNRPALAQTFREKSTGQRFTAVVNHLKSKGSACAGDPDVLDGQGECNQTRRAAAIALKNWLLTDPTGSGDPDFVILGDFNAYAKEDPIRELELGGYKNEVASRIGPNSYDFVFDGQSGSLSHMLTSPTLASQVRGILEWHVAASEPPALDYNDFNQPGLYHPDAFRSSDHEPLVMGLDLTGAATVPATTPWSAFLLFAALAAIGGYLVAKRDERVGDARLGSLRFAAEGATVSLRARADDAVKP